MRGIKSLTCQYDQQPHEPFPELQNFVACQSDQDNGPHLHVPAPAGWQCTIPSTTSKIVWVSISSLQLTRIAAIARHCCQSKISQISKAHQCFATEHWFLKVSYAGM